MTHSTVGAGARRATIRDVAEAAKVSQSTASRALTGRGYVAGAVRARVQRVAAELGYVPDVMARHLKQRVSHSVGVLVHDLRNAFYADLAAGAGSAARSKGYTMILADLGGGADADLEAVEPFVAMRVAGVVVTPESSDVTAYLSRHSVPVIEVDRQFAPETCDAVVVDNAGAARAATRHLLELGHQRIALFIDETDWTTGQDRYRGYAEALAGQGVELDPALVVSTGWDVVGARSAAAELFRSDQPPTALFAANNVLAEGVWRAAADAGLAIPADLSVVSFDDAPWMSMVTPGVTAIAQDAFDVGEAAVRRLFERLDNPELPAATTVLPAPLVMRQSTAPPRL